MGPLNHLPLQSLTSHSLLLLRTPQRLPLPRLSSRLLSMRPLPERRETLMKLLLPLLQLLPLYHTHMLLDSHMPLVSQLLPDSHTLSQLPLLLLMLQLSSPLLTLQLLLNMRLPLHQLLLMLDSHTLLQLPLLWLLQLLLLWPLLQLLLPLLLQLVMLSSPPSSSTLATPPSTRLTKHLI